MKADSVTFSPIGIVKSKITDTKIMPLSGVDAQIEVFPEFLEALERIDESSHLWILSWLHKAPRNLMKVVPKKVNPLSDEFGVFAIRCPARPNPIALSLVKLEKVEGNVLYVTGLDVINETPVLDIKPYFKNDIVLSHREPDLNRKNTMSQESEGE
ncbi:tRNA (N6-threonylcarbamoyladenosine(37)-N6)-methyltransferase TrmO [Clostridium sp. AWRP]|uniref:tRNA (N6-threonylcarbamoyladenosine(37)-N6)-methyltransferase TrmO n=1 Tax=Clostridium sp. AWRP TaxID=2212991 RepID=UPI000FDAA16A|nr:tRNA (N6-threonylcarbamoyladenosine(37)-N6)-methyltransferase TrmO [Clostridium sp. AWRP]AZV57404.1 tRNA (N6-threonylcarbamoyladenosine(37)-N6)-methyltransferase TrmO [Clostridium sp. AWRP]